MCDDGGEGQGSWSNMETACSKEGMAVVEQLVGECSHKADALSRPKAERTVCHSKNE